MMDFMALLQIIATLFLLLACGFICRKIGWIDNVASKKYSSLILQIGQPMLIIAALSKQEYTALNLKLALISTAIGIVMHIIMSALAYLLAKPIHNREMRNLSEFSLIFANCGFIGFPIMEALFGETGLFMAAFYIIGFNLMIWTWGLVVIGRGHDNIKITIKKIFVNFGTIPCAVGFGIYLSKVPFHNFAIPTFLMDFLNNLGNLCTPISVLVTGSLIATIPVKKFFKTGSVWYTSLAKLVIIPLIICLGCHLLHFSDQIVLFCTAMSALPSAATVSMLSESYDLPDSSYASQIVGTTSLLCLATLPLIMLLAYYIIKI